MQWLGIHLHGSPFDVETWKNYPDSKSSMTYRDIKSPIYLTGEASMKNEDLDVAVKDVWTNC